MRKALVIVTLLALGFPAAAGAYENERPGDTRLASEVQVALAYWMNQGVYGCSNGIEIVIADSLMDTDQLDAAGRGRDCRTWFNSRNLAALRMNGPLKWKRQGAAGECALAIHEVGHALGLAHSHDVMGPHLAVTPKACQTWAKKLYPPHRRLARPHIAIRSRR